VKGWKQVRRLFPALENYTYLNAASGSPLSKRAARGAKRYYDEMLQHGDVPWDKWLERKEKIRDTLADFIGAIPAEVAFTLNTSHGMNLIAEMLKGKGEVLTMKDEFPSSTLPWIHRGFKLRFIRPARGVYTLQRIEEQISPHTKILLTSHVQYRTGFRQDLEAVGNLCRRKNLIFVVNATQSLGAFPVDVKRDNIDFLAFLGLKWPVAGYGIGGLYIGEKWLRSIRFPMVGWKSMKDPESMDNRKIHLRREASALEMGCPHFPGIFALGQSLELFQSIGKKRIRKRILDLGKYLAGKLEKMGLEILSPLEPGCRSGITIVKVDNPEDVRERLKRKNIIVSARGGGLRISTHFYNNRTDIDTLIKGLKEIT